MPTLDRSLIAGRYAGFSTIASVGAWSDVELADWTSVTAEAIPETGAQIVSLSVRETSGAAPCYLLFRANDGEATTEAFQIAASSAETFECYIPDAPISVISVYGSAHVKAFLV